MFLPLFEDSFCGCFCMPLYILSFFSNSGFYHKKGVCNRSKDTGNGLPTRKYVGSKEKGTFLQPRAMR